MKKIQLILRIIVAPIIFLFEGFAMFLFPTSMMFIIGIFCLLGKIFGARIDETWEDVFIMIFAFILVPATSTKTWIKDGVIIE